jgi:hypothetical protein
MANALEVAGARVQVVAGRETTQASINENLRMLTNPVTKELLAFVADAVKQSPAGSVGFYASARSVRRD